jgi:hypothetical protein
MDPYLENPRLWPDVHHGIISVTSETLNRQLRPKYYVRIEERVYISDEDDPGRSVIIPDLRIAECPGQEKQALQPQGVPTPEVPKPVVITTLIDDEIHEARLAVIDREKRQVVTAIEVVNPTNKVAGSRGQASYLQKRQEVMRSPSHLVEIDLLRQGVPIRIREDLPPCDYLVHVSRKEHRPKSWLWPIRLPQHLPVVSIPLRQGDPDAKLDLQSVLTTVYDRAAYDMSINYRSEPVPPLSAEWEEWAHHLLQEKELR